MRGRVLVTRPEPEAARTAARLAAAGFEPVVLPLTETVALDVNATVLPARVDAIAVTSANAVSHAPQALLARLAGVPCFAVGRASATAARKAGFSAVTEGGGDAAALAAVVIAETRPGAVVAYLCGRVRMAGFERMLRQAGFTVTPVETYDSVAIEHPAAMLRLVFEKRPIAAALIYSALAAEGLAVLAVNPRWRFFLEQTRYLCLSQRIAAALGGVRKERIQVAAQPTEDALFALLLAGS